MTQNHHLMFDDDVYYDMSQDSYDAVKWMRMDGVLTRASAMGRSKKKFEELFKNRVLFIGDTLTMKKTGEDGITAEFSATVMQVNSNSIPSMSSAADSTPWSCKGPLDFIQAMNRRNPSVKVTDRYNWEKISVTRGNQELGSLTLLRQCLQLWEDEMEKWGCDGLGEELGQKL